MIDGVPRHAGLYNDSVPGFYEIEFLPEGRTTTYAGSAGLHYLWPDGRRLDMRTVPVWCLQCDQVREGEQVEALAAIDDQVAGLRDANRPEYCWFSGPGRRRILKELTRRREWRLARVSPARCVACGSTEILALWQGQPVVHPSQPLTIIARDRGLCVVDRTERAFTPEGVRIA